MEGRVGSLGSRIHTYVLLNFVSGCVLFIISDLTTGSLLRLGMTSVAIVNVGGPDVTRVELHRDFRHREQVDLLFVQERRHQASSFQTDTRYVPSYFGSTWREEYARHWNGVVFNESVFLEDNMDRAARSLAGYASELVRIHCPEVTPDQIMHSAFNGSSRRVRSVDPDVVNCLSFETVCENILYGTKRALRRFLSARAVNAAMRVLENTDFWTGMTFVGNCTRVCAVPLLHIDSGCSFLAVSVHAERKVSEEIRRDFVETVLKVFRHFASWLSCEVVIAGDFNVSVRAEIVSRLGFSIIRARKDSIEYGFVIKKSTAIRHAAGGVSVLNVPCLDHELVQFRLEFQDETSGLRGG